MKVLYTGTGFIEKNNDLLQVAESLLCSVPSLDYNYNFPDADRYPLLVILTQYSLVIGGPQRFHDHKQQQSREGPLRAGARIECRGERQSAKAGKPRRQHGLDKVQGPTRVSTSGSGLVAHPLPLFCLAPPCPRRRSSVVSWIR